MSWGYIPKHVREARRQKRARKKYKNFSCLTCEYKKAGCRERYRRSPWHGSIVVENCKCWKASTEAKFAKNDANVQKMAEKKQPRKGIFSKFLK